MAEYLTQEEIDALGLKSHAPEMRALSQSFKEVPIRFPSSPESWRKTIQKAGVSIPGGIREWAAGGVLGIADLLGLEGLQRIAQRNVAEAQTEGMPESGLSRDIVQRGVVGAGRSAGMMLPSLLLRGTNMTRPQQIAAGAAMIAPGIYGSEREDLNPLPAAGSALLQGAVEQAIPLPFLKPMGGGLANILKDYGIRTGGEVAEEIPQYMIHEAFRGRAPTLEGTGETTKEAIIPSAILTALTGAMPMRRRQAMGERFIPQPEAVRPEQKPAQPQTEQQEQLAKSRKGDMAPPPAEFGFEEQRQEQKVLTKPIENQVEIPAQAIVGHEEQNTIQQDTALPDADAQQIEQQVTPESLPITTDLQPPQAVNHAKLKRVVDPSRHTLLQAIALEGVDATDPLANDLRVSLGIDQNKNMRVPVPGGPPVWLFRKDGKRIDTIAGDLSQGSSAYLSTHDRQELLEKLYDNPEYLTPQGMESRARQEFEERQAEEIASATEKFEAAIAARNIEDESTEAELDWILNNGRIMTEEEANTFNREFMEALNADTTATETAFRNEARGIEAGGHNSAQAQEDYSLETQTEESIAAAEQKNANAASIAANEAALDEIRMTAEAMPLSPTGSDMAADANPNKDDIFRGLRQKNAPYTTDLFGEPVAVPSAAKPTKQRIPGDVDRTSALSRDDSEGTFATKTKLVTENKRAIGARQVITQEDAANALAYLGKGAVERFDGLVTDDNGKPLAIVGAFKGAISQTSVYPSTVAGEAFRIKDAAHIWFAHNHPSGNAEFSGADRGLNRQLMEVFRGSGIKAHGLFAIAGSAEGNRKWVFTDGEQDSTGSAKTSKAAIVPVVERVYSKSGHIGDAISSPEKAKRQIGKISAGQSGIVLLDAQNRPIGFVQIAPEDTAPLRTRGRMDAIYRAISIANASAGMVVNNGHYNTDQARNLTGLLNSLDVRALDVLDATSDGMRSWAERGYGMASTFYSRADTSQQKKHTKTTLTKAIDKAFGNGFTGRLEGTGKFKFITAEQASAIVVGRQASEANAFVKDGITHLVTDNIGLAENIKGLVLHEIGVHALTLGKNDPQFKAITGRLEALRKAGDKKAQAARNKVPDDTPEGDVLEEQLGYYVQANPDLSIAKQAIAWLRAMLRKLGANLSGLEKTRWVQWSNSLTADDMIYMATAATKKAPNALAAQGNKEGARFSKQDAELEENYGKAAGDGSQRTTKILQEAAELGRDDWFVAKRGVVPHGETKDASDALAARTGYNYDAIREALADGGQPAATIIGAGMAANRMQVANAIVAARNGDFSGMVSSLADAINTAIGVRVAMSEFARAMSYYGWAMKQGAEKLDQQEASQKTRDSSKDMLKKTGKLLSDEDIIKMLGGRKQVDVIMGKLGRDDINLDAISRFLSGMSGAMAMENTRTTTGKISSGILEYWKANILSGLFTHEVNITGNALSIALEEAAIKPIGAAIGSIRGEGQNLSDQARAAKAITGIWGNALAMAKFAAKQEYPGKQLAQIATMDQKMAPLALTTLENKWRSPAALPGFIGRTVRNYGYTPLGMEDAFAKAIVYQLELARSNGNIEQALLEADRQTFNERLHGLHGKLSHAIQGTALEFVFPFTKTLANLVKAGLRLTPGINMAIPSYREELSGRLGPSRQNDAIARMIVGSALSAAIAALHGGDDPEDEGALSGLGPATGARRKIWLQENSPLGLNTGDVSFPMYRFDPFSTQAGVTIAVIDAQSAYNAFKNGKITEDEWVRRNGDAAKSVSRVVLDKHFMANAAGILESLSEPSRIPQSAKRGLTGFVTGMIPMAGMLGQTAQMLDPYKHKPDDVVGTFHSRIPGLRNDLDPMLDVWGQQVEEPRYASPFPTQAVRRKGDPVNKELLKLGMGIGIPKWMDALSYGERKELLEQRKEMFDEAILSPDWEQMDREDQRTMIRTIQRKWSSQHSELRNELKADGKIK